MDSITHVALGAIVGEAIAGKSLGKRAMFLGAIAQSVPDIDFLAAFWLPAADNLLVHRGFTHSILFGVLATVILAVLAERWHRAHNVSHTIWLLLFGIEITIHLLLDACNAYGVGWFEPFNHKRISLHILFVADPFFSVWSGLGLVILMILDSKKTMARRICIYATLMFTSCYLFYAVYNKLTVEARIKEILDQKQIAYQRFITTPTPFNAWLWYIVIGDSTGYYTGYRSVYDSDSKNDLAYFPQQNNLLEKLHERTDVQHLLRFSQGYYTVEQRSDTLLFNDLRFEQIAGWENPKAPFVFHYYLNYPEANLMVIQRGRFTNWNRRTFRSMIRRIKGVR